MKRGSRRKTSTKASRSAAARKGWKTRRAKVDYIVTTKYTFNDVTRHGKKRSRTDEVDWVVPAKKGLEDDDILRILRDSRVQQIKNDSDMDDRWIMRHIGHVFNAESFGKAVELSPHASYDIAEGKTHDFKKITARDYKRTG